MPLLGKQPNIINHMKSIVDKWLPDRRPEAIVVFSAHWDTEPAVKITASERPSMLYDYYGFPTESYKYEYPAPGAPRLAARIKDLLRDEGMDAELDHERGFDHGVFVPLMIMYPDASIPVVCVSLHGSLSAELNMKIGVALRSLPDDGVLILGSGYTFHNLQSFFHPTDASIRASVSFNDWLKDTILCSTTHAEMVEKLKHWDRAPGARACHPREEHLLPLLVVAAAGGETAKPQLIYENETASSEGKDSLEYHAVSAYMFRA